MAELSPYQVVIEPSAQRGREVGSKMYGLFHRAATADGSSGFPAEPGDAEHLGAERPALTETGTEQVAENSA